MEPDQLGYQDTSFTKPFTVFFLTHDYTGVMKQPRKVTSHPPTAIRIRFKEYKMEIHRQEPKFCTQAAVFNIIACAMCIIYCDLILGLIFTIDGILHIGKEDKT